MRIVLRCIIFIAILAVIIGVPVLLEDEILDDAEEWNGHYYKVYMIGMRWDSAQKFCESTGGHLVTVETPAENEMLKELLSNIDTEGGKFWLGGFKDNDNIWKWVNGNAITDLVFENESTAPNATKIYLDINKDYQWSVATDDVQFAVICEWDNPKDAHYNED